MTEDQRTKLEARVREWRAEEDPNLRDLILDAEAHLAGRQDGWLLSVEQLLEGPR